MQWLIFYTDISAISVTLCNSGKGLTMQWLMVKVIDQHDSRCRHLLRLQDLCHVDWIARRLWIIRNICSRTLFLQLWTFSPSRQISTEMLDMRLPRHSCHSGRPSPRQGPPPPTHYPPPRSSFDFMEVEVIQVSSSWQLFFYQNVWKIKYFHKQKNASPPGLNLEKELWKSAPTVCFSERESGSALLTARLARNFSLSPAPPHRSRQKKVIAKWTLT